MSHHEALPSWIMKSLKIQDSSTQILQELVGARWQRPSHVQVINAQVIMCKMVVPGGATEEILWHPCEYLQGIPKGLCRKEQCKRWYYPFQGFYGGDMQAPAVGQGWCQAEDALQPSLKKEHEMSLLWVS